MFWHIEDCIISLLFMFALCAFIYRDYVRRSRRDRMFLGCVISCIIVLLVDIFSSIMMEVPVDYRFFNAMLAIYFASFPLMIVGWAYYLIELAYESKPEKRNAAYIIISIPYALYFLFVLLNFKTGWIYSVTPDGVYSRGEYHRYVYIFYVIYAAALFVYILTSFKFIRVRHQRVTLLLMPLLLGIGAFVQSTVQGLMTVVPAYAFSLFITYLFIQQEHTENLLGKKDGELQRVSEIATIDAMTGLLNHNETFARIDDFLKNNGTGRTHVLVMIDMDNFKNVNDTLGHQAGDEIIKQVASKLKAYFSRSDIIGRIGGDEFLVLMKDFDLSYGLDKRARNLLETFQFDCTDKEMDVEITVSIGIGITNGDKNFDRLYAEADAALYKAKDAGKNCYAIAGADIVVKHNRESPSAIHLPTILEKMIGGVVLAEVHNNGEIEISYVNRSYYKYLASDEFFSEASPQAIFDHIYPSDKEAVLETLRTTARTGNTAECIYRYGAGGMKWYLLHVSKYSSAEAKKNVLLIVTITNVTSVMNSEPMKLRLEKEEQ